MSDYDWLEDVRNNYPEFDIYPKGTMEELKEMAAPPKSIDQAYGRVLHALSELVGVVWMHNEERQHINMAYKKAMMENETLRFMLKGDGYTDEMIERWIEQIQPVILEGKEMDLSGHDLCEHNVSEAYCYTCLHKHITQLEAQVEALKKHIVDSEHYGHKDWCKAVCGPTPENWYRHEDCDCGRNALLEGKEQG